MRKLTRPLSPSRPLRHYSDAKADLDKVQHSKCAYCECQLNGDFGDIDHYRPKTTYPWLLTEWSNLLLTCSTCNRTYKNDAFPLEDERQRDTAHQDISRERPLLINPYDEDPAQYIGFHEHVAVAMGQTKWERCRGKTTIDLLRLNRRANEKHSQLLLELREKRWREYKLFSLIKDIIPLDTRKNILLEFGIIEDPHPSPALQEQADQAAYAGMFRHQTPLIINDNN